jgi:hypothetical protein
VKVNILKKGITQDSILVDGVKVEYNSFWLTKKLTNILTIER